MIRSKKTPRLLSYRMNITLPNDIVPCRLARKLVNHRTRKKYLPTRSIDKIERVGLEKTKCIRVDSPDHLYVTDDFILTHNTIESLGFANIVKPRSILIVGPATLALNWKIEAEKWLVNKYRYFIPDDCSEEVPQTDEPLCVITNYEKITGTTPRRQRVPLSAIEPDPSSSNRLAQASIEQLTVLANSAQKNPDKSQPPRTPLLCADPTQTRAPARRQGRDRRRGGPRARLAPPDRDRAAPGDLHPGDRRQEDPEEDHEDDPAHSPVAQPAALLGPRDLRRGPGPEEPRVPALAGRARQERPVPPRQANPVPVGHPPRELPHRDLAHRRRDLPRQVRQLARVRPPLLRPARRGEGRQERVGLQRQHQPLGAAAAPAHDLHDPPPQDRHHEGAAAEVPPAHRARREDRLVAIPRVPEVARALRAGLRQRPGPRGVCPDAARVPVRHPQAQHGDGRLHGVERAAPQDRPAEAARVPAPRGRDAVGGARLPRHLRAPPRRPRTGPRALW